MSLETGIMRMLPVVYRWYDREMRYPSEYWMPYRYISIESFLVEITLKLIFRFVVLPLSRKTGATTLIIAVEAFATGEVETDQEATFSLIKKKGAISSWSIGIISITPMKVSIPFLIADLCSVEGDHPITQGNISVPYR